MVADKRHPWGVAEDAYRQKTINMELAKLTGIKGVPVPARPAQPQSPGRSKKVSGRQGMRMLLSY